MIHITQLPLFLHRPSALWAMPLLVLSLPLKKMPVPSRSNAVETCSDPIVNSSNSVQTCSAALATGSNAVENCSEGNQTGSVAIQTCSNAVENCSDPVETGSKGMKITAETGHFRAAPPWAMPVAIGAMTLPRAGCAHQIAIATLPCGLAQTQMP
ncbi:MAG: hypothetical protein K9J06_12990 [Flavobacteriales bacterium]|nr:hypothetical protein [Flavobacteriales bacterium]